ncbi:MAG: ABC transporter permease [Elusimicrobia bacterium]|nr:ABC transporter permease [Elusimicrobiota bacterium]
MRDKIKQSLAWLFSGKSEKASHILILPASFWLAFFLIIPIMLLLVLSLAQLGPYGTIIWHPTLENFRRVFTPLYVPIVARTVAYCGAAALLCLLLGYPTAYFLSFYAGEWRDTFLILLMIPFWTSALVSIYSWIIILGRDGLMNSVLVGSGALGRPLDVLNTPFSVILGLVYFYLPFMILPLYSSLEKIPKQYIEASYDLGAGAFQTFLKVTLPLSLPGVFAGFILTFVPCLGDFLTAEFLGGPRTYLIGNLIENQFLMAQDWPFGAALTAVLLCAMLIGLYYYQKLEAAELAA